MTIRNRRICFCRYQGDKRKGVKKGVVYPVHAISREFIVIRNDSNEIKLYRNIDFIYSKTKEFPCNETYSSTVFL